MTRLSLPLILAGALLAPNLALAFVERTREATFAVAPDHRVVVQLPGGAIQVTVIEGPNVTVRLEQDLRAQDDAEADARLAEHDVTLEQEGETVTLKVKGPGSQGWTGLFRRPKVRFTATVEAPAHVALDLRTSGGNITLAGRHAHELLARTSGGSIRVDECAGPADLRTSGGTIKVNAVHGQLNAATSGGTIHLGAVYGEVRAATSGGSIRASYLAPDATALDVRTSGGSIALGVHPEGHWTLRAVTSGGAVRLRDLPFTATETTTRRRAEGTINDGGSPLVARTSGGSITMAAAHDPGR